jgi:hypothetical protein
MSSKDICFFVPSASGGGSILLGNSPAALPRSFILAAKAGAPEGPEWCRPPCLGSGRPRLPGAGRHCLGLTHAWGNAGGSAQGGTGPGGEPMRGGAKGRGDKGGKDWQGDKIRNFGDHVFITSGVRSVTNTPTFRLGMSELSHALSALLNQ